MPLANYWHVIDLCSKIQHMSGVEIFRQFGRVGNERGRSAEQRVAEVIWRWVKDEDDKCPSWLIGYKPASVEENKRGVDGWVVTLDVGDIAIQIKSSQTGARKAEGRRRSTRPVVVVVKSHWNDSFLFQRIIGPVAKRRESYLQERISYRG